MFLRVNKTTVLEEKLDKVFTYFRKRLVNLHTKEINQDNLFGTSDIHKEVQIIYIAILLGAIEYDNTLKIEDYVVDTTKFKGVLACNSVDLLEVYRLFGLLNDDTIGINTVSIETTHVVEPNVFEDTTIYTKHDIKELLNTNDSCKYVTTGEEFHLIVGRDINNNEIHLEI